MKVLIADDSQTSRTRLTQLLHRWGYEIQVANDGEEAWQILMRPDHPEMVILDWVMPGIDGVDLCKRIRREPNRKDIYIIILSAKSNRKDIHLGIHAGANDYILKSQDDQDLKIRLEAGRRIVELKHELSQKQKMQGALELAGGICHELNQPLQVLLGYSELLMAACDAKHPEYDALTEIKKPADRIAASTTQLMNITRYEIRDYLGGQKIMNISMSSNDRGEKEQKR
ncbi:MAG: response regulator [Spirochaetaceae bacterium]|nr:response regulator [Spirochaetaceae bacterium]